MLDGVKKQTISFKFSSNLIVFPMEVNGRKLNFILDSGVGSTLLFNLNEQDSVVLKNVEKKKLKGLGSEESVDAILSTGNEFKLPNIVSRNEKLYVISNDNFDLSSKMGLTIHGIIGYEILKDFSVKINYSTKKLTFYSPDSYNYNNCRKCETFKIEFRMLKPYINVGVKLNENSSKITPVKLLIDSGGSDALWLFENSHSDIISPEYYFNDFLGEGLSGVVTGKRSKIESLIMGTFEFKNPTVSYPDSSSIGSALQFEERNGSIGAGILKRFTVLFDYQNNKITFKKGSRYKEPFRYNMSGIELVYNGKILVKEKDQGAISYKGETPTNGFKVTLDYNYKFIFKPTYRVENLRKDSPAYEAGVRPGDVLIKINGKYTYDLKLDEIVAKFYEKENTKIELVVERDGIDYQYSFKLRDAIAQKKASK
ncbi:hypothetical protein EC396_08020 [Lutibacter sp. HS1-25]|uniref:retropepsin-like aspartic protease n=1 Tax=Lutibacter sp. HS1-25 TaxID=2485000 RepID=UPI0010105A5B|nr:retropepsin-like aspartic protease [Lutibacter sp. HS1-25]RXP55768.1 hypothetical protein EC396_08020 [Lutibacter sp. HS1-25]